MIASPLFKKPSAPAAGYNRPGDWLALPDMSATEGVAGLYAVGNHDSNFVAFTVAGAFDVDWGDGSTDSYASGATAEHNFAWSDLSSTTLASRGFRQAIIQITPQSGESITSLNFNVKHSTVGLVTGASTGWLDVEVNAPSCTSSQMFRTTNVAHRLLEQVTFRAFGGTTLQLMFAGCTALQSVPAFDTSSVTDFSNAFQNCNSLQSVPLFDTSSVTTMQSMFNGCNSLQSVPLFDTSSVTNFTSAFLGTALQSVPAFDMSAATTLLNTFLTNPSIARVEATGMKVNVSFANCSLSAAALDEIYANLADLTGQTGRTITVTGNYGAASDNPSIATAKNWTVTG